MKKTIARLCVFGMIALCLAGCSTKTSDYKEGTYNGKAIDNYGGQQNEATARVVINKEGKIESVYLDTTYTTSDNVVTTKKTLGDDYNMKTYNPSAAGEWYEQVEALEKAIVENQGVDFLELNDEGKTDAVSGCTIAINALVEAVNDALSQAK